MRILAKITASLGIWIAVFVLSAPARLLAQSPQALFHANNVVSSAPTSSIAFVRSAGNGGLNQTVMSVSITSPSAGHSLLVVMLGFDNTHNITPVTITDSASNIYATNIAPIIIDGASTYSAQYYLHNVSNTITSVTLTAHDSVGAFSACVVEVSGDATTQDTTQHSSNAGSGTAITTGNLTTNYNSELILTGMNTGGSTASAGGATALTGCSFFTGQHFYQYHIVGAAGSYNESATATSGTWGALGVAYR